jgi:general secretion pathway protein A
MYERFYGLRERPFELTANGRFLFLTATHREALSTLRYGISGRKGVTLLLGEAGTGKTTIAHTAIRSESGSALIAYLNNPTITREDFFRFIDDRFGLGAGGGKLAVVDAFTRRLQARHHAGAPTVLVIDEAQSLPDDLLEEVRLLANIETEDAKLLQVLLVGQPELADRLNQPSLRQLKQRIALRGSLVPLTLPETASLISGRLRIAGGRPDAIFTGDAVQAVFEACRGIPRTAAVICDNALVAGFALDRRPVGRDVIEDVCRELDLRLPERTAHAAAEAVVEAQPLPAPQPAPEPVPAPDAQEQPAAAAAGAERPLFNGFSRRRRLALFG